MSLRLMYLVFCHLAGWLTLLTKKHSAKEVEILVLRERGPAQAEPEAAAGLDVPRQVVHISRNPAPWVVAAASPQRQQRAGVR